MVLYHFHELICDGIFQGWSVAHFVNEALILLKSLKRKPAPEPGYYQSIDALYNCDRLSGTFQDHNALEYGYRNFVIDYKKLQFIVYPALKFVRQQGAKTKRIEHVKHEGVIKLKTDLDFWASMNNENDGGFGLPHAPFGFRSWMRTTSIDRKECLKLGLLKHEKEVPFLSPALREKWGLSLISDADYADKERLKVVEILKQWGVWSVRQKMLDIIK